MTDDKGAMRATAKFKLGKAMAAFSQVPCGKCGRLHEGECVVLAVVKLGVVGRIRKELARCLKACLRALE